jgi:hypothetical protein
VEKEGILCFAIVSDVCGEENLLPLCEKPVRAQSLNKNNIKVFQCPNICLKYKKPSVEKADIQTENFASKNR